MEAFKQFCDSINWPAWEAIGTWFAAAGTLAAVFYAMRLARRDVDARRVERRGEIIAMIAEASSAGLRMKTLVREVMPAPLYRLPSAITKRALPKLIGDGQLSPTEIDLLVEFSNKIDEVNRGLERAGDAHAAQAEQVSEWLKQEHRRNVAKAKEVIEIDSAHTRAIPLLDNALDALFRVKKIYESH
jgi:hypothetical protein